MRFLADFCRFLSTSQASALSRTTLQDPEIFDGKFDHMLAEFKSAASKRTASNRLRRLVGIVERQSI
jgi:hypothetical protein